MDRHALLLALVAVGVAGCSSVDSSSGRVNAPCTRDYDCASGLTCLSGVCAGPAEDAASPVDSSAEAAADAGGSDG